jgi:HK97 gp10 family phage protein
VSYSSVQIKGLAELNRALAELPPRVARNVLRGSVAAGAAVIRDEARVQAPRYEGQVAAKHPPPGTLKRAIYSAQARRLSSLLQQVYQVGVISGKRAKVGKAKSGKSKDAYYWRFVEFGTVKMAARPFLRPAFEAKKMQAVEAIRAYMAERIPREVAQLPKGPRM